MMAQTEDQSKLDQQPQEGKKLTLKQEKFCILYATDARFFGNATRAYAEAYNIDLSVPGVYNATKRKAADNLAKPHLLKRINQLLEDIGFSDVEVDKQLAFLIAQHTDYRAKIAAIKEYNALKGRITKKIEADVNVKNAEDKYKEFLDDGDDDLQDDSEEIESPGDSKVPQAA